MKQVLKLAPLMLALAAVAMPAAAKDKWRGHDKHDRYGYYDGRYDRRDDRDDDRRWDDRRWDDRDRRYHPVSGHWDNGRRGPPPWARGRDYRSYGYRQVYYVPVNDYGRYRLYRPDYGYRWVRDDRNNFLLVAATSGIISQILSPGY